MISLNRLIRTQGTKVGLVALTLSYAALAMTPHAFSQDCSNPAPFFAHLRAAFVHTSPGVGRYREFRTLLDQAEAAYSAGQPDVTAGALDLISGAIMEETPRVDPRRRALLLNVLDAEALLIDSLGLTPYVARHWTRHEGKKCNGDLTTCEAADITDLCYEFDSTHCGST